MPRRENLKRKQAAKEYQETGNMAETARRVGVNRATIARWLKDPGFLEADAGLVEQSPGLVPKALDVLNSALMGEPVKTAQFRAALEIAKASGALREVKPTEEGESLADRIARLDEESAFESD